MEQGENEKDNEGKQETKVDSDEKPKTDSPDVKKAEVDEKSKKEWASHVQPHKEIVELFPGRMWQVVGTFGGKAENTRNMVLYKLDDGGLWCHSVVALNEETQAKLEALGTPTVFIVPNGQHSIDAGVWQQRYPNAKLLCPAKFKDMLVSKKRLRVDGSCEDLLPKLGVNVLVPDGIKPTGGFGVAGELCYELKLSENDKALVFTDILMFGATHKGIKKFLLGNTFEVPRAIRWVAVKNVPLLKAWINKVADIANLKIISVAHGDPIVENAGQALKDAANKL